ncbi:MAG: UDP-N-acetylmuramate dehydrogenase [Deltaproteobacteria bacterium]|jgi:UDP-N-acetylmuramate dehydrogenase|nr:UDP-N-acetylmuramate dehydrogenase [Deltaproteobacteria bacterium]
MNYDLPRLKAQLIEIPDCTVKTDEMLAPYTSYNIGGPADLWVAPETEEAVGKVLEVIHASGAPLFILGRGSNLLVSDKGWSGVSLYMGENLNGWNLDETQARVLAGTLLMDLIHAAVADGLGGMELMAGIPGGIGGALRMNAGAFGQEIESVTSSVKGFLPDGSPFELGRAEIDFCYRRAPVLEDKVITSGVFGFSKQEVALLKERMQDILLLRAKKQPLEYPSCGSVFKRPPGYYAGALIEEAGLKGEKIGGAMVSEKHSGFILNVAEATAADVYTLIRRIENKVHKRFGVTLEREVKLIGNFSD